MVTLQHMTLALRYSVIEKRNFHGSMEMSFFAWNMEMSFFGMPLYILDICPENRDESNGNSIVRLWLQFIPIFRALHSQLRKGHTKKRHPHVLHMHCFSAKGHKKRHLHALFHIQFLRRKTQIMRLLGKIDTLFFRYLFRLLSQRAQGEATVGKQLLQQENLRRFSDKRGIFHLDILCL